MYDEEDYSFFTGGIGDVNDDGIVDEVEYLMEEEEYFQIMEGEKDDSPILGDDDDDWEMLYLDTAEGYGLSPYDYADKEEFLEALQLAKESDEEDTDFDEENEDSDMDLSGLPENFDISKLSLTIGATTSLNYDGVPIDQAFGIQTQSKHSTKSVNTTVKNEQKQSVERRYYDREDRIYRIGDAIYDNFTEINSSFERHECEDFSSIIEKVYRVDNALGVKIWLWVLNNFKGALVNQGVDEYNSMAWTLTDCIFGDLHSIDGENDNNYIFEYASKHPELEEILFHVCYIDDFNHTITSYIPYCIENNLRDNFIRVYNGFMTNKFRDEKKLSKYAILEDLLSFCQINGLQEADGWYYSFFEKEINSLNKPLKRDYLIKLLNAENYGKRMFLKPNVDDVTEVYKVGQHINGNLLNVADDESDIIATLKQLKNSLEVIMEEVKDISIKIQVIESKLDTDDN